MGASLARAPHLRRLAFGDLPRESRRVLGLMRLNRVDQLVVQLVKVIICTLSRRVASQRGGESFAGDGMQRRCEGISATHQYRGVELEVAPQIVVGPPPSSESTLPG